MSPVNRASSGHEILSSAAKEDLNLRKGLIPRVFFLREMRKFSREIIVRMRDEDK